MASVADTKVSCIAFGFTLGFGYLTAWDAYKITRLNSNPLRSIFVWMVWLELVVNLAIAVISWLFLEGTIKPGFLTYFFILCLWVFEIQCILQIIITRVAIITMNQRLIKYVRWGTVCFIMCINITVFCIWIPAQMEVSQRYIDINRVWDKITKVLIGLNDACLNYYFIDQVQKRLVANGLQKYNALARFNTRIILISVGMDILIIGTMFLKNGVVFLQFHPVAYTVKLKIELSMTNLIMRISQESVRDRMRSTSSNAPNKYASCRSGRTESGVVEDPVPFKIYQGPDQDMELSTHITAHEVEISGGRGRGRGDDDDDEEAVVSSDINRIHQKREVIQVSESKAKDNRSLPSDRSNSHDGGSGGGSSRFPYSNKPDDEEPLAW